MGLCPIPRRWPDGPTRAVRAVVAAVVPRPRLPTEALRRWWAPLGGREEVVPRLRYCTTVVDGGVREPRCDTNCGGWAVVEARPTTNCGLKRGGPNMVAGNESSQQRKKSAADA